MRKKADVIREAMRPFIITWVVMLLLQAIYFIGMLPVMDTKQGLLSFGILIFTRAFVLSYWRADMMRDKFDRQYRRNPRQRTVYLAWLEVMREHPPKGVMIPIMWFFFGNWHKPR